jgi:hypothetical protein
MEEQQREESALAVASHFERAIPFGDLEGPQDSKLQVQTSRRD